MPEEKLTIQTQCTRTKSILDYERDRFESQIRFSEFLISRNTTKAASWKRLIARASERVQKSLVSGNVSDVTQAVRAAEEILTPVAKEAKTYTVYAAAHAHIDMNWMWSWPETVNLTNDTFTTVLRLLEEFPEFRFSQSQASVYKIVERFNPDMLKTIRRYVTDAGKSLPATGWKVTKTSPVLNPCAVIYSTPAST